MLVAIVLIAAAVVVAKRDEVPPSGTDIVPTATSSGSTAALPYGTALLHVGETAHFNNYSITLVRITEDSRCAKGVTCIQAGTLKAQTISVSGMGTSTQIIELGKTFTTEVEEVTLVSATPYPEKGKMIIQSEYALSFDVSLREIPVAQGPCYVGGCSWEVCSGQPNVVSNCIYREEFACYKTAKCERQSNGICGWTDTASLRACIVDKAGL